MKDTINELDAAVTGESAGTDFEEQHPDAPEWAHALAAEIEANGAALAREERAKKQRQQQVRRALEEQVAETRLRIARLAASAGAATDEEKQLLKEVNKPDLDGLDGLAKLFAPSSNSGEGI